MPVAVIIIAVSKLLSILCVQQVGRTRTGFIPCTIEGEKLISNRYLSNTIFRLTGDDVKILFIQMDIFLFLIQKLGDPDTVIKQHQDDLIILVLLHCPDFCNFLF